MRVGVDLVRLAVRGPAGVTDAQRRLGVAPELVAQVLHPAGRLGHLETAAVHYREARRVVAAVLQPVQPLDKDRCRVPLANVANDAAHVAFSLPLARSAIDNAPQLAPRQLLSAEPAGVELGRDLRPDLVVLALFALELVMPPTDESSTVSAKYAVTSATTRVAVASGRPVDSAMWRIRSCGYGSFMTIISVAAPRSLTQESCPISGRIPRLCLYEPRAYPARRRLGDGMRTRRHSDALCRRGDRLWERCESREKDSGATAAYGAGSGGGRPRCTSRVGGVLSTKRRPGPGRYAYFYSAASGSSPERCSP